MDKPIVYWGGSEGSPLNQLLAYENLLPHLKKTIGKDEQIFGCPASLAYLKNMKVLLCPFDVSVMMRDDIYHVVATEKETAAIILQKRELEGTPNNRYIQLLEGMITLFSEQSVEIEITPPFLHPNGITCGVFGKFDISKWYRPIHTAQFIGDQKMAFSLKKGDPLLYIKYNQDVIEKRVTFPKSLESVQKETLDLKSFVKTQGLRSLYSLFSSSNSQQRVAKIIKDYNGL